MFILAEPGQRAALQPTNVNWLYVKLHRGHRLSQCELWNRGVMGS